DACSDVAQRQARPPGEVPYRRGPVAREVALRQLRERLVAIKCRRPRDPLVEQREGRLLALMMAIADEASLGVVGKDVQSARLPRVQPAASVELDSGLLE